MVVTREDASHTSTQRPRAPAMIFHSLPLAIAGAQVTSKTGVGLSGVQDSPWQNITIFSSAFPFFPLFDHSARIVNKKREGRLDGKIWNYHDLRRFIKVLRSLEAISGHQRSPALPGMACLRSPYWKEPTRSLHPSANPGMDLRVS